MKKIKILVLSYEPWDVTNSFGNSYRSIFRDVQNVEIANIYCLYGMPNDEIVKRAFQITDKGIINSYFSTEQSGYEVDLKKNSSIDLSDAAWKKANLIRRFRPRIVYWVRDLLWIGGGWKSKGLQEFITSFNPDVIWIPIYYSVYLNQIALYIQRLTHKKLIGYISDDNYTLKQWSVSPLYWIERIIKRQYVKRVIEKSELLYVISDQQKKEYDKIFNINSKVLTKGGDFNKYPAINKRIRVPYKIVFIGNLSEDRWKSLKDVIAVISSINDKYREKIYNIDVYSMTPMPEKRRKCLHVRDFLPDDEVNCTLREADIVLHLEPRRKSERLKYRLSFSTKMVTYFENSGCVLAYGGRTGTTDYIEETNCGIYVSEKRQLYQTLIRLKDNPNVILKYKKRSWECGKEKHNEVIIARMVRADLEKVILA